MCISGRSNDRQRIGNGGGVCLRVGHYEFLNPPSQKFLSTFPRHPQRPLVESDCWTVLDRLTLAAAHRRSSFICRTTGRARALVTERAWIRLRAETKNFHMAA